MTLVAGVDSSTQAVKVVVCDADTGDVVRSGRAPHPDGTECDPQAWLDAFGEAADGLLDDVAALGVAGQQHGMVPLDADGAVIRPALLWNDTRSADDAVALVAELGPATWADAVGSVPVASFTVSKLRWLARAEPGNAAAVASVLLPHDWLTWQLAGRAGEPTTDRGDASGTGYWSPAAGEYRLDLLRRALGREVAVPRVAAPADVVGRIAAGPGAGAALSAGTGDNMAAALGLDLSPGDVVISLGTSGTAFAVADSPSADARGLVAGFADATGRWLPLACTLNAARVLATTAGLLGVGLDEFSALALEAAPGSDGLVWLPYLDGERTPDLPAATGTLGGITRSGLTPAALARAAIEGVLCGMADALDAVTGGARPQRVLLIGGAAASPAVQHIAAAVLGQPVHVPPAAEYVALGAARQAAWALAGSAAPPAWDVGAVTRVEADPTPQVRAAFTQFREQLHPGALSGSAGVR